MASGSSKTVIIAALLGNGAIACTPEERAADDEIKAHYSDAIVVNSLMPSGIGIQGAGGQVPLGEETGRRRDADQ